MAAASSCQQPAPACKLPSSCSFIPDHFFLSSSRVLVSYLCHRLVNLSQLLRQWQVYFHICGKRLHSHLPRIAIRLSPVGRCEAQALTRKQQPTYRANACPGSFSYGHGTPANRLDSPLPVLRLLAVTPTQPSSNVPAAILLGLPRSCSPNNQLPAFRLHVCIFASLSPVVRLINPRYNIILSW